jgi:hypothetical protein
MTAAWPKAGKPNKQMNYLAYLHDLLFHHVRPVTPERDAVDE